MTQFIGTEIFWETIIITPVLLMLMMFIGSAVGNLFPNKVRFNAEFYLAPSVGLAILIIIASTVGRFFPLGDLRIAILFFGAIIILALIQRQHLRELFKNYFTIGIFGIVCGASVLVPLYIYGAFDPHNDAFTYLAHSYWLQNHAFNELISPSDVKPLTTQIFLYQLNGFRMGGSFILAFVQSLFNLTWSYDAYPSVIITSIASCCLAMGFLIAQAFDKIKRNKILLIVSLPALSLGGLVFAANFGFLPQIVGLSQGVGFLAVVGAYLYLIVEEKPNFLLNAKLAFLSAILFSGAVFAYSEIMPFLLLAAFLSGLFFIIRPFLFKNILVFASMFFLFVITILNFEVLRVIKALLTQASAIVGAAVEWPLFGFVAHAMGVHGGAWDILQWSYANKAETLFFITGLLFTGLIFSFLMWNSNFIWKYSKKGIIMPFLVITVMFSLFFLYFRYAVPSPFSNGVGQSWSQFKISDWMHPFLAVLILFSFASLQLRIRDKIFNILVLTIFAIFLVSTIFISVLRIRPLINDYQRTSDLDSLYTDFRKEVNEACPKNIPIYLNIDDSNLKIKQMALLYLYDREVRSDWTNDVYISYYLPMPKQEPVVGDCMIELMGSRKISNSYRESKIKPFSVRIFDGDSNIIINNISGAYAEESNGEDVWNWVEKEILFNIQNMSATDINSVKISFEYKTLNSHNLILRIIKKDGSDHDFILDKYDGDMKKFDKTIQLLPSDIARISIVNNGDAIHISKEDSRMATFLIKNMSIQISDNIK